MKYILLVTSLFALGLGCASQTNPIIESKKTEVTAEVVPAYTFVVPPGARGTVSSQNFESTYKQVRAFVESDANAYILAEVDHQKNAKSQGLELEPTRVLLYSSKNTEPILSENPITALDLPQRILVYERDGLTYVLTNTVDYIRFRFEISNDMVASFAPSTFGPERISEPSTVSYQGLNIVKSKKNVDDTYNALKQLLIKNENLKIMAEHDFAATAKNNGTTLQPLKMIIFGNPKLGTPMMKKSPSIALDLPQKMLIYFYKDAVHIAYNNPAYLGTRHNMTLPQITDKISAALGMLSSKAAE